jgi:hypothetical protein
MLKIFLSFSSSRANYLNYFPLLSVVVKGKKILKYFSSQEMNGIKVESQVPCWAL